MSKYILSFLAGLSISLLVLFFIKLFKSTVQRHDLALVLLSFTVLLFCFGYYVFRRVGQWQKNK
ncbi:MAG: hypothetical protein KF862_01820 [Chitinophagaceae bacterium]|nr:hypothetical protein [Chitinophagaceae bacterium]